LPRVKSTHVDTPEAAGRRLREARLQAGLSQRQLAFPGCTAAYISRVEAGERTPSLQILRELGRRLGLSADYLATGASATGISDEDPFLEAEVALRLDDSERAEELYLDALARAVRDEERAAALGGLGQLAYRSGDPHRAIAQLEEALALFKSGAERRPSLADTLGRAYALTGDLAAAIAVFQRFLAAAERRDDAIETMRFTVLLANALIDSGNFGGAEELLGRGLALAEDLRDPIVRARLYWSQSRLHALRDDQETAARYGLRALEIVELTEHTDYAARAHQLLAHIELDRDRPAAALELLEKGWPLLSKRANRLEQAEYRLEEARALAALGRSEEAAALAMQISGLLGEANPQDAGRGYSVLAEIYESLGERARARELYELAAELLERNPNRYLIAVYSRLAELLEAEGRKEAALELLKRAVGIQAGVGASTR
jgi:tetratricopeptide (TPR) repeat protein